MRGDVDRDVQAARGPAARTDLALVREPDLVALVDARRDRDTQRALALGPAVAMAGVARRLDDLALAAAARAGADVDHLPEHGLADAPDLAAAVALRARDGFGPGLRPVAAARLAPLQDAELDLLLGPVDGLGERDPQVVAQVRAGLRSPATSGPTGGALPEERIEDVREAAEALEARPAAIAPDAGPAEHVVALTTLRVGQDLVGLVDLLEPLLGLGVRVDVGVPLLGELAEGALDLGVGGAALDAQDLVVVALRGGHAGGSLREPARTGGPRRPTRPGQWTDPTSGAGSRGGC